MAVKGKVKTAKAARKAADPRILKMAVECARIADARRGEDITVLAVEGVIFLADYFVLVSAANKRQTQAIAFDVRDYLRTACGGEVGMEGCEEASWVLLDSGSIVVHIFREDLRSYYDLELLWGDAPKICWQPRGK